MERSIQVAEVERELALSIAISTKNQNENRARAEADARAEAVREAIAAESAKKTAADTAGARLEALPGILAEVFKPAEKIKSINVNNLSGGFRGTAGDGASRHAMGSVVDSIMGLAVHLPLRKKIGDQMGVSLDDALKDSESGKADNDACTSRLSSRRSGHSPGEKDIQDDILLNAVLHGIS